MSWRRRPARAGAIRIIVDETLEPARPRPRSQAGDVVGIGIHTGNALRGYEIGRLARERGAWVVYGGIHATLFPDEVREHGAAHAVVKGDGDLVWPKVVEDCFAGHAAAALRRRPRRRRAVRVGALGSAAEGPLHVGLGADGARLPEALLVLLGLAHRRPGAAAARASTASSREIVELRRLRLPVHRARRRQFLSRSRSTIWRMARRRTDTTRLHELEALRDERFELMAQLAQLPDDLVFFTQITMEAAEDPSSSTPCGAAHIRGALVGVESVTPEGLKDVYKGFNLAGDELVARLQGVPRATASTCSGRSSSGCRATARTRSTRRSRSPRRPTSRSRSSCCSRRSPARSTSRSGRRRRRTATRRWTASRSRSTG